MHWLWLCLTVPLAACEVGLKDLEYRPSGREQRALSQAAGSFANRIEREEHEAIAAELDLPARKALLVLGASLAYEKNAQVAAAVEQAFAGVILGAALMFGGDPEPGVSIMRDAIERSSRQLDEVLTRDFGASATKLLGTEGAGGTLLDRLAARHHETEAATRERLVASLRETARTHCEYRGRLVSYDFSLLRFTTWQHADLSHTFVDWKKRARSLHLVELACAEQRAFVVLATEDDYPQPRVVFFRFLPPEAFDAAKQRLLDWLATSRTR